MLLNHLRMKEICKYEDCTGCGACFSSCALGCIAMNEDNEGFYRPVIDNTKCTNCNLCVKICPINNTHKTDINRTYIGFNKNSKDLRNSSSGGIFTALCKAWSYEKTSYKIYGAAFNEKMEVIHLSIDNISDIAKFQGSKYVQSNLGNCFKDIKLDLMNGIHVLFSGTPCQVAGLRNYLKKDYDKLLCIDLVCHGTPSPKTFLYYKMYLEQKNQTRIKYLSFTNKVEGWINKYFYVVFANGKVYKKLSITFDDPYMSSFLRHNTLRPSCFTCKFADIQRVGDITLADSWGVEKLHPHFNYHNGSSMILIISDKGMKLFDLTRELITCFEDNYRNYLLYNPQLCRPSSCPSDREKMIKLATSEDTYYNYFDKIIKTRPRFIQFLSEIKFKIKHFV